MPVRSSRKKIKADLPECFLTYFLTGEAKYDESDDASFDLFLMRCNNRGEEDLRKMWDRHKEIILAQWIKDNPGSRPFIWWDLDSPRQPLGEHPGWYYDGKLPQPRLQISGTGKMMSKTYFRWGVNASWLSIDPENVPVFESEPHYLKRHGLLPAAEEKRLKASDFEPVPVTDIFDFTEEE